MAVTNAKGKQMSAPAFFDTSGPLDQETIKEFEKHIGATLPGEFREFLAQFNGAAPVPNIFDLEDYDEELDCLYILGLNNSNDIRHFMTVHKDVLDNTCVPVGVDSYGNVIWMSLKDDDYGYIYFYDLRAQAVAARQARLEEGEPGDEDNFFDGPDGDNSQTKTTGMPLIAESFDQFLDLLREPAGSYSGADGGDADFSSVSPQATAQVEMDLSKSIERIFESRDMKALETLIAAGYDIEQIDDNYLTLLENAATVGDLEMVKFLTMRGAKMEAALSIAQDALQFNYPDADHKGIVDFLKKHGKAD